MDTARAHHDERHQQLAARTRVANLVATMIASGTPRDVVIEALRHCADKAERFSRSA